MMVLMALPLVRESALPVTGGVVLAYFFAKEFPKNVFAAALTGLPTIAWWMYDASHTALERHLSAVDTFGAAGDPICSP